MKNRNEKVLGFSPWAKWAERSSLQGLLQPGVYAIARSGVDISGKRFSWPEEVIYFGMTNSQGGLNARLNQFDNAIKGKKGHGGGTRVYFKYKNYKKLVRSLYVSVYPKKCNVDMQSNSSKDLRIMGEIVKLEYVCLAIYKKFHTRLPEFNDKKRSPKK